METALVERLPVVSLYLCFGRYSIVQTSIVEEQNLPVDILADEHHIRMQGQKAYVATTVGKGGFLVMQVSRAADESSLQQAYGVFKKEATTLSEKYQPDSVNTDGWTATQNAWKALFPTILVIECFLHAFLKVRDRATKNSSNILIPQLIKFGIVTGLNLLGA